MLQETRKRADTRSADYKAKRTSVQLSYVPPRSQPSGAAHDLGPSLLTFRSPQKAPAAASVVSIPANKAYASHISSILLP